MYFMINQSVKVKNMNIIKRQAAKNSKIGSKFEPNIQGGFATYRIDWIRGQEPKKKKKIV